MPFCAQAPQNPDETGEQLRHIVDVLRKHAKANGQRHTPGWRDFFPDMAVFLDWGSLHQKDPRLFDPTETPDAQPEAERSAFVAELKAGRRFYGGEAYEKSRSAAEYAAFKRGLHDTMDVWYSHKMIVTLFVTKLPEWYTASDLARVYADRGWVRARAPTNAHAGRARRACGRGCRARGASSAAGWLCA